MTDGRVSAGEWRFLNIIWRNEPVGSGRLVELCQQELGWAKSTTYTRLHILIEKGMVENKQTIVTSLISREQVQASESAYVVNETFEGSLPGFVAAFLGERKLTEEEADALRKLIDGYREG